MANILVVDDEIGIRELLDEILSDEGHTVNLAENAQHARMYRKQQRPDLVLLDIWMPDTDGLTLLKEWSETGVLDMPVIMMSGHATIDTAVEATKIGALNFLEKPIALQKLLAAVEYGLIRGRQMLAAAALAATNELADAKKMNVSIIRSKDRPVVVDVSHFPSFHSSLCDLGKVDLDRPLREVRDDFEKVYFMYHLKTERGSMTRVAEKTGLERTHLYRKLKQLGLDVNRSRGMD